MGSDKFFGAQKELRSATCGPKIKWIMGGKRENKYWKISCNTRSGRIHYSSRFDLPCSDKFTRLRRIWRFVSFRFAPLYVNVFFHKYIQETAQPACLKATWTILFRILKPSVSSIEILDSFLVSISHRFKILPINCT